MVLQLTVFWYIGAVLGHVCLGLGVLALGTMLLNWVFFFPQWVLGVCVVLWSVGCKSIQFLVHSFNPLLLQAMSRISSILDSGGRDLHFAYLCFPTPPSAEALATFGVHPMPRIMSERR